jgi:hypothetical protein
LRQRKKDPFLLLAPIFVDWTLRIQLNMSIENNITGFKVSFPGFVTTFEYRGETDGVSLADVTLQEQFVPILLQQLKKSTCVDTLPDEKMVFSVPGLTPDQYRKLTWQELVAGRHQLNVEFTFNGEISNPFHRRIFSLQEELANLRAQSLIIEEGKFAEI